MNNGIKVYEETIGNLKKEMTVYQKEFVVLEKENNTLRKDADKNNRKKRKDFECIADFKLKWEQQRQRIDEMKEVIQDYKTNVRAHNLLAERNRQETIASEQEKSKIRLAELASSKQMYDYEMKSRCVFFIVFFIVFAFDLFC